MITSQVITIAAIFLGPISAVLVTLWIDARRQDKGKRVEILRRLITTRRFPADPTFVSAINLIPVEFNRNRIVLDAYNEFIEATNARLDGTNDDSIIKRSQTKLTRLIYSISEDVGFKLRETDIETSAYASDGWILRDKLNTDAQQAIRDLAMTAALHTKHSLGAELSVQELEYLGIPQGDKE